MQSKVQIDSKTTKMIKTSNKNAKNGGKRLSIALTLNDKQFQSGLKKATQAITKFGAKMKRTDNHFLKT